MGINYAAWKLPPGSKAAMVNNKKATKDTQVYIYLNRVHKF